MSEATVNNQLRLAGRTAIVTGAGRGIGRAIAELYAREGARVVIASRSTQPDADGRPGVGSLCDHRQGPYPVNNGKQRDKED